MNELRKKIFDFILTHQPKREKVMYSWDSIRSISIIANGENVDSIAQTLLKEGKHVDIFPVPNKKDICWFSARPKADIREALQARNYDLLIDLTQDTCITALYMAMYIRAGFKTSRHKQDKIYDLIIDTPAQDTSDFLFEQIVKYIRMFTRRG